jgi:uncharacterized RDD family membrane protein YckC
MGAQTPLDLTATVMTPENVQFEYRLAGPFRRFPAFFLDLLVRLGAMVALFFFVLFTGIPNYLPLAGALGTILLIVGYFLFDWFYGLFFETIWNGKTPGKYASGLRVIWHLLLRCKCSVPRHPRFTGFPLRGYRLHACC